MPLLSDIKPTIGPKPVKRYKKSQLRNLLERAHDCITGIWLIEEKCFVCKRPRLPGHRRMAVDHCHKTNQVRGLLCYSCNYGIGVFRDSPARLRAAADYLENPKFCLNLEQFDDMPPMYSEKAKKRFNT